MEDWRYINSQRDIDEFVKEIMGMHTLSQTKLRIQIKYKFLGDLQSGDATGDLVGN